MNQEQKNIVKKLLWDYNFTEEEFMDILTGKSEQGSFNRKWAIRRAIEGMNYYDLIDIVGLKAIAEVWPEIRDTFRIKSIKEGIDYVLRKYNLSTSR
jgi:hypothetical protein